MSSFTAYIIITFRVRVGVSGRLVGLGLRSGFLGLWLRLVQLDSNSRQ